MLPFAPEEQAGTKSTIGAMRAAPILRANLLPTAPTARQPRLSGVTKTSLERRLVDVGGRIRKLREDIAANHEQMAALADEAYDSELRAVVGDTPFEVQKARNDSRHVVSMRKAIEKQRAELMKAEKEQDQLLDEYSAL